MEQDRVSLNMEYNNVDKSKFTPMKQFVSFARDYMACHSEKSLNSMNKCLSLISLSDKVSFHPSRVEVSSFYSSLCGVMGAGGGVWGGVSVLARAVKEEPVREALTHNYRFLPVLAPMLTDNLSFDKKYSLLSLMEELTHHIRIEWVEGYVESLLHRLCEEVLACDVQSDAQRKRTCALALGVLCNLCQGNPRVTQALMYTNPRELLRKVLTLQEGESGGGVQVCRLLQVVQGRPTSQDVHSYLTVTLRAFTHALRECEGWVVRHCNALLQELWGDPITRGALLSYHSYLPPLQQAIQGLPTLISRSSQGDSSCLVNCLQLLHTLVSAGVLGALLPPLCQAALQCSHLPQCCAPLYDLLAACLHQEESRAGGDVAEVLCRGVAGLLTPPPSTAIHWNTQWVELLLCLQRCGATQGLVGSVSPHYFEEVFYHTQGVGETGLVLGGCLLCLELAQGNCPWSAVLHRMLADHNVCRILSSSLGQPKHRERVLSIVMHPHFPKDKLQQVFCVSECVVPPCEAVPSEGFTTQQQHLLEQTILRINQAMENNAIEDIPTSHIMDLYRYKITCLEQRLNVCTTGLQGATQSVTALTNSISLLEATNRACMDTLYSTQQNNEKLRVELERGGVKLVEAEQSIQKFQGKLAAERLHREHQMAELNHTHTRRVKELEGEVDKREGELSNVRDSLHKAQEENTTLTQRLADQVKKNSELAEVLLKFEERVKQRDKKIEEATTHNTQLKNDLHQAQQSMKGLEKTLLERDKRVTQLTTQLEEMQRIQEIIANLMGNKTSNSSNNSLA